MIIVNNSTQLYKDQSLKRKQQESNHTKKTQVHNIGDSQSFTACGRNTDAPDG